MDSRRGFLKKLMGAVAALVVAPAVVEAVNAPAPEPLVWQGPLPDAMLEVFKYPAYVELSDETLADFEPRDTFTAALDQAELIEKPRGRTLRIPYLKQPQGGSNV